MSGASKHKAAGLRRTLGNGSSAVVKLSRVQIVDFLEKGARDRTGMSARIMLRRYRQGKLTDPNGVIDLIALSNLLRKNDPILAE